MTLKLIAFSKLDVVQFFRNLKHLVEFFLQKMRLFFLEP